MTEKWGLEQDLNPGHLTRKHCHPAREPAACLSLAVPAHRAESGRCYTPVTQALREDQKFKVIPNYIANSRPG